MGPQLLVNANYDFVGWRKVMLGISVLLLAVSLGSIFTAGLNLGVEFTGGAQIEANFDETKTPKVPVTIESVRDALDAAGATSATVVTVGSEADQAFLIRLRTHEEGGEALEARVQSALAAKFGDDKIGYFDFDRESLDRANVRITDDAVGPDDVRAALTGADLGGLALENVTRDDASGMIVVRFENATNDVLASLTSTFGDVYEASIDSIGAAVSEDLKQNALLAIIGACVLIAVYVWLRFDVEFAPGVILSLANNAVFVVGVWSVAHALRLPGFEFTLTIVAAVLAVIGYSVNDTVVIYDRIRENIEKYAGKDLLWVVNKATNETLSRTLLTAGGALLATAAIGVLGSEAIRWFGWAMFIGVVYGTWSTIAVAMPLTVIVYQLRERQREVQASAGARAG